MTRDEVFALKRPVPKLLTYYVFCACAALIAMPVVMVQLYFRYHTMRYQFDAKGISMSWGILFRRETYLTYGKIQDIQVTRNLLERWMGLGSLQIQTASGSADAEMTLVGIPDLEGLRDYIYSQMKGHEASKGALAGDDAEKVQLLKEIRDTLTTLAQRMAVRQ